MRKDPPKSPMGDPEFDPALFAIVDAYLRELGPEALNPLDQDAPTAVAFAARQLTEAPLGLEGGPGARQNRSAAEQKRRGTEAPRGPERIALARRRWERVAR